MFPRPRPRLQLRNSAALLAGLASCVLALAAPARAHDVSNDPQPLAVMGTIPIYWGEGGGFGDALAGSGDPHWARAIIEQDYDIVPVDYLSAEALAGHRRLLLAQPRGFSAEENVALDAWVRAGGRVLLFADPQMTGESRFALGDRRRPQDVALLSPILAHWGLLLEFDPQQTGESVTVDYAGVPIPTQLAGYFTTDADRHDCATLAAGLVAQCRLGRGFALIVADAAMLNLAHQAPEACKALDRLMVEIFGDLSHNPYGTAQNSSQVTEIHEINFASCTAPESHPEAHNPH